ncbi:hypothetical protein KPH14_003742 [Odynerus spinipes]|uniref:Uncharacterized protein n=1 Tax=Odynerus spinipes TaxID=1348599 RepID=A0AAD9RYM7_9HYME|nr:hypothetical protein KPH14_003742 [Odynerus spinipes]
MKISSLRNVLAEAESDITRGTACKLRDNIVKMRENFATEKKRLTNEIQRLKRRVSETEEKWRNDNGQIEASQLKLKLQEFASGDRTMEMLFKDIVGRIAVTVPNLSEELVNASEDLYRSNCENGRLRYEVDKLKAILRINTGDPDHYLKRIAELKDISRRLTNDITHLRNNIDESAWSESWDFWKYLETIKGIEETINDLGKKIKTDRHALIMAGNPICFRYVKKIVDARLMLKRLYAELENSLTQVDKNSTDEEILEKNHYTEKVSVLKKIIDDTGVQLGRLKVEPASNYKLGGNSCLEYLKKVKTVEEALKRCKEKINEFDVNPEEENHSRTSRLKTLDELRELVDELCSPLKELENMLSSREDSKLLGRIEELEELLVKTKLELSAKEEAVTSLEERLERGRKELEERQEKNAALAKQIDAFQEDSKYRLTEMRRVKIELDGLKQQLQGLRSDKESLFVEMETMRKQLTDKTEEMSKKLAAKDNSLRKLQDALERTSREKEELSRKLIQHSEKESPRVRTERELSQTKSNLNEANSVIFDLRKKLERAMAESKKFESEIGLLTSVNETLKQQSIVAKKTEEELLSKHATLEKKVGNYNKENNELRAETAELRAERKLLKSRMDELDKRNGSLLEQVEKWKITQASLEQEAEGWKVRSNEFASVLERANGELRDLRTENSTLSKDLGALTLKNNEAEARLRVASTEKDDLARRRKELNEENVSLKDRLNKARTEREYLSQELNKSRIECDKTRSRNMELEKMVDEHASRYKALDDQARTLRATNEILRTENEKLKTRSSEFLERLRIAAEDNDEDDTVSYENEKKKGKNQSVKVRDKVKSKDRLRAEAKMLRLANESFKMELANLKTENAEIKMELTRIKNEPTGRSSDVLEISEFQSIFLNNYENESRASSSRVESRCESFPSPKDTSLEPEARQELRQKFETLSCALSKLRIVNSSLKTEIDVLRDSMHSAVTDKERAICELRRALEELKALKVELIKLREEKGMLRTRLDGSKQELDNLSTEKTALKEELALVRRTNADLKMKIAGLQDSYEKLRTFNVRLENRLLGTLKNVNKYTVSSESYSEFEKELNGILKEYASIKESLGITNRQLDKNQKFAQGESTNVNVM